MKTAHFAESYDRLTANCCSDAPDVKLTDEDEAAIYFSSGTTGFPKAILHTTEANVRLLYGTETSWADQGGQFFMYSALYHTGAKMHWFGSLLSEAKPFCCGSKT